MISLVQMSYIIEVAKTGSFSEAAFLHNVSQPTVSMQIKKAEKEIGATIFDRRESQLELTDYGKELMEHIQGVFQENNRLKDFILEKKSDTLSIEIGVIPTMSLYIVPFLLGIFKLKDKKVRFSIRELPTETLLQEIKNNNIDLGIMAGNENMRQVTQEHFGYEDLIPYVNGLASNRIKLNDLKQLQPWLLSNENCLSLQTAVLCGLNKKKDNIYSGGDMQLLIEMVNQHQGFTFVPSNILEKLNYNQSYEKFLIDERPVRELVVTRKVKNSKYNYLSEILDLLKENFGKDSKEQEQFNVLQW